MERVLFVDDEDAILSAVERLFSDVGIPILRAGNAAEALGLFAREEIAVVVSDHMMPGMRGVDFLAHLKGVSPDTVKILMTAHADLTTAMDAINNGEVYRFIAKPWDNEKLIESVSLALNRYRMQKGVRQGDESMLRSLAQTIELKDPYTGGHCDRVAGYALSLGQALGLEEPVLREIKHGSWLHDCGKIGVPDAILNYAGPVSGADFEKIKNHPLWGAQVARQANLSDTAVNIILHHHEHFDGNGYPYGLAAGEIPIEARIVAVADVYDALASERPYRKAYPRQKAAEILKGMAESVLDPELVELFLSLHGEGAPVSPHGRKNDA